MSIYYAHCQAIYGTPQEARDLETLRHLGFAEIINPSDDHFKQKITELESLIKAKQKTDRTYALDTAVRSSLIMNIFTEAVSQSQALAFRALPDGRIPAGVAKEIQVARENNIPVFELPSGVLSRTLSVDETREVLRELGQR